MDIAGQEICGFEVCVFFSDSPQFFTPRGMPLRGVLDPKNIILKGRKKLEKIDEFSGKGEVKNFWKIVDFGHGNDP